VTRPWTIGDLSAVVTGETLGLVAILLGWYAAAGRATPGRQTAWIALGGAGLIVAGAGNAVWLRRARRSVARRRAAVLADCEALVDHRQAAAAPDPRPVALALAGAQRFHRPDCPLVAGKPVTTATARAHERASREPCAVCAP
jgi:hypothetical protein